MINKGVNSEICEIRFVLMCFTEQLRTLKKKIISKCLGVLVRLACSIEKQKQWWAGGQKIGQVYKFDAHLKCCFFALSLHSFIIQDIAWSYNEDLTLKMSQIQKYKFFRNKKTSSGVSDKQPLEQQCSKYTSSQFKEF